VAQADVSACEQLPYPNLDVFFSNPFYYHDLELTRSFNTTNVTESNLLDKGITWKIQQVNYIWVAKFVMGRNLGIYGQDLCELSLRYKRNVVQAY